MQTELEPIAKLKSGYTWLCVVCLTCLGYKYISYNYKLLKRWAAERAGGASGEIREHRDRASP